MKKEEKLKTEYSIYSIYCDMVDTPLNINIKRLFMDNILLNIHNKPAFLIRFLKQKDILRELYNNIVNENEIGIGLTLPSMIFKDGTDPIKDAIRIANDWFNIIKNNKPKIENIIFITSKYINIIDEIIENKDIFLITNSEMAENYNTKNVNIINYDKYTISEIEYNDKKKEYAKRCWKVVANGNSFINLDILCKLNMFAEALNNKNLDYSCLRYCHNIENMEREKMIESIEQYILYYDYKNRN